MSQCHTSLPIMKKVWLECAINYYCTNIYSLSLSFLFICAASLFLFLPTLLSIVTVFPLLVFDCKTIYIILIDFLFHLAREEKKACWLRWTSVFAAALTLTRRYFFFSFKHTSETFLLSFLAHLFLAQWLIVNPLQITLLFFTLCSFAVRHSLCQIASQPLTCGLFSLVLPALSLSLASLYLERERQVEGEYNKQQKVSKWSSCTHPSISFFLTRPANDHRKRVSQQQLNYLSSHLEMTAHTQFPSLSLPQEYILLSWGSHEVLRSEQSEMLLSWRNRNTNPRINDVDTRPFIFFSPLILLTSANHSVQRWA